MREGSTTRLAKLDSELSEVLSDDAGVGTSVEAIRDALAAKDLLIITDGVE